MLHFYHLLTRHSAPLLRHILQTRLRRGKEDEARLPERMGRPGLPRPAGKLVWFHAASVGEAQSTLILIDALLARFPALHVLVTTGTRSSATIMEQRLPDRATHQFYPVDHPDWIESFINHWNPDMILWMESELWPNMLRAIRMRNIHCVLVNAHMSKKSYYRWKNAPKTISALLSAFDLCLAQTEQDAFYYRSLGAVSVKVSDNLKYSATPLPFEQEALDLLKKAIKDRPIWLYASTHAGEEDLSCRLHLELEKKYPNLLTIIVPRHPERRNDILSICHSYKMNARLRGDGLDLPQDKDQIYVADTLGELGLFYRLSPVSCIGRSFSDDGGGGHNPIEAALLGSAVLHGPNVQNQVAIFHEMDKADASICVNNEYQFLEKLNHLLSDPSALNTLQENGKAFSVKKSSVLIQVIQNLEPFLIDSGINAKGVA